MFRYKYQQHQLPTNYYCEGTGAKDCKCKSHKKAYALSLEIERKISEGTIVLSDYFPKSSIKNVVSVSKNISFAEYSNQYLSIKEKLLAHSTFMNTKSVVKKLQQEFESLAVADIKPMHIRKFIGNQKKKVTLRTQIAILTNIFNFAVQDEIINSNPCKMVKLPKLEKKSISAFTDAEAQQILNWIDTNYPTQSFFFALGFYAGMRIGEILALNWDDLDLQNYKIHVSKTMTRGHLKGSTKTNRDRDIDIIPRLDKYIEQHKIRTKRIGGRIFNYKTTHQQMAVWKRALASLGLPNIKMYAIRHTFACLMLGAGENPKWIAEMLGHADLSMLFKIYGNWYKKPNQDRAGTKIDAESQPIVTKLLPNKNSQQ